MTEAIVKTLNRIVGQGGYRPEQVNERRTPGLPQTMRELIECKWDDYEEPNRPKIWNPCLNGLRSSQSRLQLSTLPIDLSVFKKKRCRAPQQYIYPSEGVLGLKPLCQTFWSWLLKNDPKHLPDIEHILDDEVDGWPLMIRFSLELRKIGPYDFDDLFGPSYDLDGAQTCCAWMPLYDICDDDSDRVPLLLYLENTHDSIIAKNPGDYPAFSETIIEYGHNEGWDVEDIRLCERVFIGICRLRRWRLLPKLWARACRALEIYPACCLTYYDPDQVRYETGFESGDPQDMDDFLDILKKCCDVMEGTWELVKECDTNAKQFWLSFLKHLWKVSKRYPDIIEPVKKNRPLIEVLT